MMDLCRVEKNVPNILELQMFTKKYNNISHSFKFLQNKNQKIKYSKNYSIFVFNAEYNLINIGFQK
jgi:hypothetical protein